MLGDKLREARERKGLTIKDVENGTSIRSLYIECLENGDYSKLPGEVYVKGFIRNYANFLGLDAKVMVGDYVAENHPEQLAKTEEAAEAADKMEASRQEDLRQERRRESGWQMTQKDTPLPKTDLRSSVDRSHRRTNLLLGGILLIVVLAAAGYFLVDSGPEKTQPQTASQTQQKSQTNQTKQDDTAASQPAKPAQQKTDGVDLQAKFTDRCWTEVKADGKVVYSGTVEKGQTKDFKAKDEIVITAGNAGAVEYTVNGKSLGTPGETGQVAENTFKKDAD